ncbi:hypothetical protein [Paraburkholderia sp. J67]|uniref:hypothetical protein n=1 Tax=Paraburkholderia sp. J67 TaxID=2805435 RepID=UPI002ABE5382|nr:hypothetical protein [Paraburkholderia sp. J67]
MTNAFMNQTQRTLRYGAPVFLAVLLCASLAACGDGNKTGNNGTGATAAAANTSAAGAGGASAPVAIVAAPASGACAASGTAASQPLLNTQLDCAP